MLPFLKPKKLASIIIAKSKKDGGIEDEREEAECHPDLMKAAEDMIGGFNSKDAAAVVDAMTRMHKFFNSTED